MKFKILSLLVVTVLLSACALPIFGTQVEEAEEQAGAPSPTPSAEAEEDHAIGGPGSNLDETGPWWLLAGTNGAWAVNADGSGLSQLISDIPINISNLERIIAPSGGHVAYLTYQDAQASRGLTLKLLTLPAGGIQTLTALTSDATEPAAEAVAGDTLLEAQRAITEPASMAWSPDGGSLVFTGVMDGPTADLYLYRLSDGPITRLTHNTAHAVNPIWAPEGERVAFTTVSSLGTGAGYTMQGLWVVDTIGNIQAIPYAPGGGFIEIIGWISPDTLLVDTWSVLCGSSQLTAVRVPDGSATRLWEGCFNASNLAYDTGSGVVMTTVESDLSQFNPQPGSGLLWADAKSGLNQWISTGQDYRIDFLPQAGIFAAAGGQDVLLISPDGSIAQTLSMPSTGSSAPLVSNDASTWILSSAAGDTLWLGDSSGNLYTFPFQAVEYMTFVPGQSRALIKTSGELFLAAPPDFTPTSLGEGFSALTGNVVSQAWVMP